MADPQPWVAALDRLYEAARNLPPCRVAVTTAADCYGQPPASIPGWCIYDPDEDDPPLAETAFRDQAVALADLWNAARELVAES